MDTFLDNLQALGQVVLAGVLLGAGLPAVFALGVRFWAAAGTPGERRGLPAAAALTCFALVLAAIMCGVLYTARGFLAARLGLHVFGA